MMIERRPLKSEPTEGKTLAALDSDEVAAPNGGEPKHAHLNSDIITIKPEHAPTLAAVESEIEAALSAGELSLQDKFALFERKLRAALADSSVSASELAALLQEAERACAAAADCAAVEAEKALDPTQYPDPVAARNMAESAAFMSNRLKTMQPRLAAHFEKVYAAEQVQAYLARLRELRPEHELLQRELHDTYQEVTDRLVGLFTRVRAFEARARQQLGNPPGGVDVLNPIDGVRLLDKVVLPVWQQPDRNLWPPPADFSAFAASVVIPSVGSAWADPVVQERQRAERAAEQERMARHYAAQAAEQLERENRQLRENFEASQRR
jgi:hypothetical protein